MENRKAISLKLPPDVLDAVDEYCRRQPARPTRTAVIEAAICSFLDARIDDGSLPRRASGTRVATYEDAQEAAARIKDHIGSLGLKGRK